MSQAIVSQASTPAFVDVPDDASINSITLARVERTGENTMLERRDTPTGPWLPVSANRFIKHVNAVARGLIAYGINPGDRVAIMSRTRYEWTLLDYACWAAGAVPVPIYETSSIEQIEWILTDTAAKMIVVESQLHEFGVESILDRVPELKHVLVIDKGAMRKLRDAGESIPESELIARRDAVVADDLATIIYTSGSTGRPKGVELTHRNIVHVAENAKEMIPEMLESGGRTIIFLPLAHVFARVIQVAVLASDTVLGHSPDVKNLVKDLKSFKPTFLLVVPRVLEKVFNSAAQSAAGSKVKENIFHWATRVAISYSRAMESGTINPALKAAHATAQRLVLNKLKDAMGGKVEYAISGGAPLGERLGHFYRGLGLTVLEGYGLTETSAPATVNMPSNVAIGTVGPPIAGTSVAIADDGEILIKGPHVFRGYRNQPELTAEVLTEDGWFHTGDIGTLDNEDRLRITGRKKELIVTAGGKNVSPTVLEDRLRSHPLISQVVVVGDQRPFIGALVTLDAETLPGWLESHNLPPMTVEEAKDNPVVMARLQRAVDRANQAVSRAESIRKFTILDQDFTEQNGYLTPSMKIRRPIILKDFAADVDDLYGGPVHKE